MTTRWRATAVVAVAALTIVEYYFASKGSKGGSPGKPLTVLADGQGRYCVRWPAETAVAHVSVPALPKQAITLVSPDASGTPGGSYLIASSGQPGLTVTSHGWQATTDCTAGAPPWYRVDDVKSNLRYRLLLYLPILAAALAGGGVVALRREPRGLGRWAATGRAAAAVAGVLLCVVVWVTHIF